MICVPASAVTFILGLVLGAVLIVLFAGFLDYRKRRPRRRTSL